eukprot:TRINITY_DN3345_c1_g1_i1.p1 TRINITY_DN3345_c1_g1~~TRINITY_DN3345_c1_g1_i1.p1  ORF type:complete len:338 (-),score=69.98 TRINITY_DN3345_c1_g1_i1:117-1130(-)
MTRALLHLAAAAVAVVAETSLTCDGSDNSDCSVSLLQQEHFVVSAHLDFGAANGSESLSAGDPAEWLKYHNYWRCVHNSPEIHWDADFAAGAQEWADRGQFQHADCYNIPPPRGPAGENLASGSAGYMTIRRAVDMWHDENPERGPRCGGHCTAMLWKAATKLGCGLATNGQTLLVCRYGGGSPVPNMAGAYEANVGFPDDTKEPQCRSTYLEGNPSPSPPPPPPPPASPTAGPTSAPAPSDEAAGQTQHMGEYADRQGTVHDIYVKKEFEHEDEEEEEENGPNGDEEDESGPNDEEEDESGPDEEEGTYTQRVGEFRDMSGNVRDVYIQHEPEPEP